MSSKHRQPRLRASCDGCFLAKVKCSKARPICSRCLACGIECRYSPSSRAGKPKSDGSNQHHSHNHSTSHLFSTSPIDMGTMAAAGFSSMTEDKGMIYPSSMPGMAWQNHYSSIDGPVTSPARNHSISSELALLAMDESASAMVNGSDAYNATVPWTPPADMSMAQFTDSGLNGLPMTSHAGYSMHVAAASAGVPWMDASAIDTFSYNTGDQQSHGQAQAQAHQAHQQMPTPGSSISSHHNYFPSPSTTPSLRHSPTSGHKSVPLSSPSSSNHHHTGGGSSSSSYQGYFQGTCACFTSCLHSLQALHNASTPAAPPFDVVLALNRNAVDGCSAMLSCTRCMSRSGTHTAAMLLATVIGKVTSFYKNASQSYFTGDHATVSSLDSIVGRLDASGPTLMSAAEPGASVSSPQQAPAALLTGLGVSLGAYHLQGEDGRWIELEILNRELKKLEDVYSRFREVCGEMSEDVEVSKAMIGYLGHNLGSTLNMVGHSKGDIRFI